LLAQGIGSIDQHIAIFFKKNTHCYAGGLTLCFCSLLAQGMGSIDHTFTYLYGFTSTNDSI